MSAVGHVHLVGIDGRTGTKLPYTLAFFAALVALRWAARGVVRLTLRGRAHTSARF